MDELHYNIKHFDHKREIMGDGLLYEYGRNEGQWGEKIDMGLITKIAINIQNEINHLRCSPYHTFFDKQGYVYIGLGRTVANTVMDLVRYGFLMDAIKRTNIEEEDNDY